MTSRKKQQHIFIYIKKCTAVRNIDRIYFDKNRIFFVFIFLSLQFQYNVQPYMLIKLYCLIPFQNFKINMYISCCPWSEVYMILAFLPYPICLFPFTYFGLSITRTFLDFPGRLEESNYQANGSRRLLPGHACVLHARSSLICPGQNFPPFWGAGCEQFRTRVCFPNSQDLVQLVHDSQVVQLPSTWNQITSMHE